LLLLSLHIQNAQNQGLMHSVGILRIPAKAATYSDLIAATIPI